MAEIDQAAHVEQAEHQAVLVHDARHVVERVHAEEQQREPKCTLLNRAESLCHEGSCWYYSATFPGVASHFFGSSGVGVNGQTRALSAIAGRSSGRIDLRCWSKKDLRLRSCAG